MLWGLYYDLFGTLVTLRKIYKNAFLPQELLGEKIPQTQTGLNVQDVHSDAGCWVQWSISANTITAHSCQYNTQWRLTINVGVQSKIARKQLMHVASTDKKNELRTMHIVSQNSYRLQYNCILCLYQYVHSKLYVSHMDVLWCVLILTANRIWCCTLWISEKLSSPMYKRRSKSVNDQAELGAVTSRKEWCLQTEHTICFSQNSERRSNISS